MNNEPVIEELTEEDLTEAELAAAERAIEELPEPPAPVPTRKRGHAVLVRRYGETWIATGMRGRSLQIFHKKDARRSHYFSALGRKRR